ncbi:MAG: hypothetical protein ABJH82_12490 [Polaribacter sp.]|uniref:hypothetical protein n=1 Tax=Polaribacter sp. TaxID=1920175 RepID=UPI003267BBE3
MKKQILNIGKALNKAEQKSINGGIGGGPFFGENCDTSHDCNFTNTVPSVCCSGICIYGWKTC